MSRDKESLFDIQAACDDIAAFMRGKVEDDLHRDIFLRSAVLYQIAVIGEAVKRLSPEFCTQNADIPWRNIAA